MFTPCALFSPRISFIMIPSILIHKRYVPMKSVSVLRTVSALLASAILLWPITAAAPHYSEEVVVLVDTTADASV